MNSITNPDATDLAIKVPVVITLYFWLIKILATTVGETAADYLIVNLHLGLSATSVAMGAGLAGLLYTQVKAERYVPWLYWITVVLISIVGTLITDNLTDNLGVPLEATTVVFAIALAVTFFAWHRNERTLSIHSIHTTRRELFYWLAILFTFALGTAAGDLMAESLALGYATSAVIVASVIGAVTLGYYAARLNSVLAFWAVYILTRPLGASFGDYLSQPVADGGLGLGTVVTSGIFLAAILGLIGFLTVTRIDAPRREPATVISSDQAA
ncbi:COG4705 family protein [Endothiovibrio diazotrophicus]